MEYREPNIFKYATKELSQDAFLCWLLDWINVTDEEIDPKFAPLKRCAIDFVCSNTDFKKDDFGHNLIKEIEIRKQECHVDILIQIQKTFLIIEDKINSTQGDDQVPNYVKEIYNKYKPDKLYVGYFKTGILQANEVGPITGINRLTVWNYQSHLDFWVKINGIGENAKNVCTKDINTFYAKYSNSHPIFISFIKKLHSREIVLSTKKNSDILLSDLWQTINTQEYRVLS